MNIIQKLLEQPSDGKEEELEVMDPEIIDEMDNYHGRTILHQIEEKEKMIEENERRREEGRRMRVEEGKKEIFKKELDEERQVYSRLKKEYIQKKEQVGLLTKSLGITDYKLAILKYEEFQENRANIKKIIEGYKEEVKSTEQEIEILREKYMNEKFEEEKTLTEEEESRMVEKSKFETDAVEKLEFAYLEASKELYRRESEMKRVSALIRNSCTTVSRVLYQLENNVGAFYRRKRRT